MEFLSSGDGNAHLCDVAFVEVEHQRYDGQTLFVYLVVELEQLFFVQQQFAWCAAVSGEVAVGGFKLRDMRVHQKELSLDEPAVGIVEVGAFGTQRLDFAALQHDTRFELLEYLIVVSGFFVLGYDVDGHTTPFFSAL